MNPYAWRMPCYFILASPAELLECARRVILDFYVRTKVLIALGDLTQVLQLSRQPLRSYSIIASAIIIAGILIAASLFVAVGKAPKTTTSTVVETQTVNGTATTTLNMTVTSTVTLVPPNFAVVNSSVSKGLELSALIGPVQARTGQNITVTALVTNTLVTALTVNATSMTNPAYGPCEQTFATGVDVYLGNYTMADLSQGKALLLYDPSLPYTCPTVTHYQYSFSPNSDVATSRGSTGPVVETSVLSGYYTGSGQSYAFNQFPPGVYTVKVFDAWGQAAIGHFEVTV